jgi:hypothetical protein
VLSDEEPSAAAWLETAISASQTMLTFGGADGAWFEGMDYVSFALDLLVDFLDPLARTTGQDLFGGDFLHELPSYLLYLTHEGMNLPLEDSGYEDSLGEDLFVYRLAAAYHDGLAQWLADQHCHKERVRAFIWRSPDLAPVPADSLPLTRHFASTGTVLMRSGWGPDDLVLAFKSGSSRGHAHPSQNEFVLLYGNRILSGGAGYVCQTLEDATFSHNGLLVDGLGQCQEPGDFRSCDLGTRGRIVSVDVHDPHYVYALGDAHAVYMGGSYVDSNPAEPDFSNTAGTLDTWLRHLVLVGQRYLVLYDQVAASSSRQYDLLFHLKNQGYESCSITPSGDTITFAKEGIDLVIKVLEPATFEHEIVHYDKPWGHAYDYVKVRPATAVASAAFLTVHYPLSQGSAVPEIERVSGSAFVGARVTSGQAVDLILFGTSGGPVDEELDLGAGAYAPADGGAWDVQGTQIRVSFSGCQVIRLTRTE